MKSTTVTMLSKEDDDYLYVEAYSQMGFRLSNGFRIVGPCVLFPRSVLHWGVSCSCVLFPQSVWHWGRLGVGVGCSCVLFSQSVWHQGGGRGEVTPV